MKLFLAVLLLTVQTFAAEPLGQTKIEDEAMKKQYREATQNAISGKSFSCRNLQGKAYDETGSGLDLSDYSEVFVNRGEQPVLLFTASRGPTTYSISVSTTPDYKNVTGLAIRKYEVQRVNSGTLVDPNFVNQNILTGQDICTAK